jgi:hypothetical protein
MYYHDKFVIGILSERRNMSEEEVFRYFLGSETRKMFEDYDTYLWSMSPLWAVHILETEMDGGDPWEDEWMVAERE